MYENLCGNCVGGVELTFDFFFITLQNFQNCSTMMNCHRNVDSIVSTLRLGIVFELFELFEDSNS
jgi:hypothetical protein